MNTIYAVLIVISTVLGPIPEFGIGPENKFPQEIIEGQLLQDMEQCKGMFPLIRKTAANLPNSRLDFMACIEMSREELQTSQAEVEATVNKILNIKPK